MSTVSYEPNVPNKTLCSLVNHFCHGELEGISLQKLLSTHQPKPTCDGYNEPFALRRHS